MALDPAATQLTVEHIRLAWEYAAKEVELHQQRLVQAFAVCLSVGLTAVASVMFDKVPAAPGLAFGTAMFAGAFYAHLQIARLPRRLRAALVIGQQGIEMFKRRGGA